RRAACGRDPLTADEIGIDLAQWWCSGNDGVVRQGTREGLSALARVPQYCGIVSACAEIPDVSTLCPRRRTRSRRLPSEGRQPLARLRPPRHITPHSAGAC